MVSLRNHYLFFFCLYAVYECLHRKYKEYSDKILDFKRGLSKVAKYKMDRSRLCFIYQSQTENIIKKYNLKYKQKHKIYRKRSNAIYLRPLYRKF